MEVKHEYFKVCTKDSKQHDFRCEGIAVIENKRSMILGLAFASFALLLYFGADLKESMQGLSVAPPADKSGWAIRPPTEDGNAKNKSMVDVAFNVQKILDDNRRIVNIDDRKAGLVGLQLVYINSSASGRKKIADFIRDAIARGDEISGVAVMVYSRLGYFGDTYDILKRSHVEGVIDDNAYYSENLRHALSEEVALVERAHFLEAALSTENEYTAEVLFSMMRGRSGYANLDTVSREKIADYIESSKPEFSSDFASLGIISSERCVNWLLSSIHIERRVEGELDLGRILVDKFKDGFDDPREALSLYTSTLFQELKAKGSAPSFVSAVEEEVRKYSESYPNNQIVKMIRG